MDVLGVVEEVTHDGNIIVRGTVTPEYGNIVYDSKKKKIGSVKRVFGPVDSPYISVTPSDKTVLKSISGKNVYFEGETQYGKNKRRNG
jgi:RNA-binding protein